MERRDYLEYASITLEDTGLFNYKGRQSTTYNILTYNGITNLCQLFTMDDNNEIKMPGSVISGNFYIHDELKGIILLLRYKYLGEDKLSNLLNKKIDTKEIRVYGNHVTYGYPGDVFKGIYYGYLRENSQYINMMKLYKILKKCGFDQSNVKAIMDDIALNELDEIVLGEYLLNIDLECMSKICSKVKKEYTVLVNKLVILLDCYKNCSLEQDNNVVKKR